VCVGFKDNKSIKGNKLVASIFEEARENGKLVGLGRIAWSGNHLPTSDFVAF